MTNYFKTPVDKENIVGIIGAICFLAFVGFLAFSEPQACPQMESQMDFVNQRAMRFELRAASCEATLRACQEKPTEDK